MKHYLIAAMTASTCCSAMADGPDFKFSGFGTLGGVVTNTDDAQFRANMQQDKGADKTPDFGVDSRLGLQENVKFNEMFSAVGQVLSTNREGTYRPNIEWLYAQATVVSGLDLRAGRMVLPAFMSSDSRSVGYSSYWVRAPRDVYDWYPPTYFDGGQALYRYNVGGFNVQVQASLGKADAKAYESQYPAPVSLDFSKLSAVNVTVDNGNWTARIGQTLSRDVTLKMSGMTLSTNQRDSFSEAGLQYDDGHFVAQGEFVTRRQSEPRLQNSNAYYLSTAYRLGAWTPFVNYSRYVRTSGGTNASADTKSLGLRWDAFKNVALKAQLDRALSLTGAINESPAYIAHPTPINALSIVADFVF